MKYGRFLSAFALLFAFAADSGAGMPGGPDGAGGTGFVEVHGSGGRHFHNSGRFNNSGHFNRGQHFSGKHFDGKHHHHGHHHHGHRHHGHRHHHSHGQAAVIIGVPLFWSGYEAVRPYTPPPPQAYISQDDVNPVWYYCDYPRGYYPYVAACPAGWRQVEPTTLPQW